MFFELDAAEHTLRYLPQCVLSNIVYQYNCGMCNSKYIGETSRHYTTRIAEHMGVSPRTGAPMAKVHSNIHAHHLKTGHRISKENFSVLYSRGSLDLQASESIAIHQYRPDLNDKTASVPLNILCAQVMCVSDIFCLCYFHLTLMYV